MNYEIYEFPLCKKILNNHKSRLSHPRNKSMWALTQTNIFVCTYIYINKYMRVCIWQYFIAYEPLLKKGARLVCVRFADNCVYTCMRYTSAHIHFHTYAYIT